MTVRIRPATYDDVDGIRAVAHEAWHAAHAPIVGEDAVEAFLERYYGADDFRKRVDREAVVLDVAVEGDTVVGYVLATPKDDEGATFDLSHIYVDPERWGESVGRRLLEHVEGRVAERGGDRLSLAVMADNDRAVSFYEAAGYERVDAFHDDRIDTRSYVYEKPVS